MNKEEIKDIMKDMDDKTVEKISADYKVGDDSAKERIYKEIVRRMNSENDAENTAAGDEVRGVETYRRRNITRIISAAAAFIIVAGAVGGGAYLLKDHKSKSPVQTSDEIVEATTSTEAVTVTKEPAVVEDSEPMTKEKLKKLIKQFENDPLFPYTLEYTVDMSGYTGENDTFDGTKGKWDGVVSADIKYGCLDNEGKQQYRISKYNYSADVNKDAHPSAEEMYLYGDYAVNFTKMLGHEDTPSCRIVTGDTIEYLVRYREHNSLGLLLSGRGCYESDWDIVEGKNFIGRNCIMIKGTGNELVRFSNYGPNETRFKLNFEALIDSETGMCLYLAISDAQDAEYNVIYEAKSLSIGEDSTVFPTEDEMADMIENCGSVEGDNSIFNTTYTKVASSSSEAGQNEVSISKQEIYDKCISNAIESYAYTFESECITKNPHDSSIKVDRAKKSSSPDLRSDSLIESGKSNDDKNAVDKLEYYTFDDKEIIYIFDSNYGTNTKIVVDTDVKSTRETDEEKDQGTTGTLSAFTTIEQICDTPSDMAKKLLTNFSTWEIKGIESYLSRECAIIEGWGTYEALNFTPEDEVKKVQYTLYVDIETGAWLKASYNDKEFGDMNFEVKRFSLGDEAEKPISKSELKAKLYKLIDEEGYAIIDMNDENIRGKENIYLSFLDE